MNIYKLIVKKYRKHFKKLTLELKPVCDEQIKYAKEHPDNAIYADSRYAGLLLVYMLRKGEYFCYFCLDNHIDHRSLDK